MSRPHHAGRHAFYASFTLFSLPFFLSFFLQYLPRRYVPEEEQHQRVAAAKSLRAIQTEEVAVKELIQRYGGGNVRVVKS
jgi:hypothetical protein